MPEKNKYNALVILILHKNQLILLRGKVALKRQGNIIFTPSSYSHSSRMTFYLSIFFFKRDHFQNTGCETTLYHDEIFMKKRYAPFQ